MKRKIFAIIFVMYLLSAPLAGINDSLTRSVKIWNHARNTRATLSSIEAGTTKENVLTELRKNQIWASEEGTNLSITIYESIRNRRDYVDNSHQTWNITFDNSDNAVSVAKISEGNGHGDMFSENPNYFPYKIRAFYVNLALPFFIFLLISLRLRKHIFGGAVT